MKTFIIALAMLFSSASIAQTLPEGVTIEEFPAYIEDNMIRGFDSDIEIYTGFINKTHDYGTQLEQVIVAMRFALCSITWRKAIELGVETDAINEGLFRNMIWRSIMAAKLFVYVSGGEMDRVESMMIPFMAIAGSIPMTGAHIESCTALDFATFINMKSEGLKATPPEDWELKPIPEYNPDSGAETLPGFAS